MEEICNRRSKDYAELLSGSIVITNYGKRKTYKVYQIRRDMNPTSTFRDANGEEVSFVDYYKAKYALTISVLNQPLVEVRLRQEWKFAKGGKLEKKEVIGYLIPEFISLTGLSQEQRTNYECMKEISQYTKLRP